MTSDTADSLGVGAGLETSVDGPAEPSPRSRLRPGRRRIAWGAGLLAVLVAAAWLPWEWSFIDDSLLLTVTGRQVSQYGRWGGLYRVVEELANWDRSWGLFRPAYWVYVPAFYQLPVGAAHAVRLGMLVLAVLGPLVLIGRGASGHRRRALVAWTGLTVIANGALFAGVWYPSLQELSGLCFVGLGLLAWRRPWLVASCWTVAAWFKSPFGWLLLAFGLFLLLRSRARMVGAVSALLGAGTVGLAVWYGRTGSYTSWAASRGLDGVPERLLDAAHALSRPGLIIALGAVALRPRLNLRLDPQSPAWPLLAGGAGYLASLLLWRTDAYYAGPYVYLLSVGALLMLRDLRPLSGRALSVALVLPLIVAAHGVARTVEFGWQVHSNVTGLRDCVLGLPAGSVVGYNRAEAAYRLNDIAHLRRPGWTGSVVPMPDGSTAPSPGQVPERTTADYYAFQPGFGPGTPSLMTGRVVCRTPLTTVYKI